MIDKKKLFEVIKEHSYPITQFDNSVDIGMTLAGIKQAIDEQPKIGGWIPCSERLPEKNGFVYPHVIAFAYEDNGWNMYIAAYDFYEDKKWRQAHGDMEEIYDVSYWMPLPKEPQHGQMD